MIRINQLAAIAILLAAAIYYWLVSNYAINAPYRDDLLDILRFLVNWVDSDSWSERWQTLLAQHNDHRTAASRLLYLLQWSVGGEINFTVLTALLNLAPLFFLLFFYFQLPVTESRALILLPVALLLFQPSSWVLMHYPMAGLAMFGMLLYAALSLLCLSRPGALWLLAAGLCASLSTFSLASGQLIWLIGMAQILLCGQRSRTQKAAHILGWGLSAVLILSLFHIDASSPNSAPTLFMLALESPLKQLGFLLVTLGNVGGFEQIWLAGIIGALVLGLLMFILVYRRKHVGVMMLFALFLLLTCAAITVGRAAWAPLQAAAGSKFSMPSVLMLCCLWLLTCQAFPKQAQRALLPVACAISLLYVSSLLLYQPRLEDRWQTRTEQLHNQRYPLFGSSPEYTRAIVARAQSLGIYRPGSDEE